MASIKDTFQSKLTKEGVDHINVSAFANTNAGVTAALDLRRAFSIPHLGSFGSPRCFANYIGTMGDERYRHNLKTKSVGNLTGPQYRAMSYFAKFHQLASNVRALEEVRAVLNLPWTSYRVYLSGVREYDRHSDYPLLAKDMCLHLLNHGVKKSFDWDLVMPGLIELLDQRVAQIAKNNGVTDLAISFAQLTGTEEAKVSEDESSGQEALTEQQAPEQETTPGSEAETEKSA